MSVSITARLLFASRHCYVIAAAGPLLAAEPQSDAIGYGNPLAFVGGPDAIDAGLIGKADDGIILAFRGTLPPDSPNHAQTVRDWLGDVDAALVTGVGLPGLVHAGFLGALDGLWNAAGPQLLQLAQANPRLPVYLTGHSKGGPVANLAALRASALLSTAGLNNPLIVCTFAGARAGDADFAAAYDKAIPHSTRFEFGDDVVPHLPPEDALRHVLQKVPELEGLPAALTQGYVPVGDLQYIARDGAISGDSPLLQVRRIASLAERMMTFGFSTIVSDHSSSPGSGYAQGVSDGA